MVSDAPSLVEPPISIDPLSVCDPDFEVHVSEKLSTVQNELFSQFSSVFMGFC